ncbi:MAG TPA: Hsp20/alpha crystallin family protein [Nitrospirota bacterium]|nr:Hsp20/alpha crystallin family protein [Nitrospirota bacterium]
MDIKNLIPFGRKNIEVRREEENPFAMMQREMNRLFDSFSQNWGLGAFPEFTGSFMPRLDLTEDAKAFTVTAELPGMTDKDIDLSIAGDTLTIRGEKKEEKEDKNKNYYYSERSYGSFLRSIPLPRQVETDKVSASFKKGVLTVTLPKTAAAVAATKKISVKGE